MPSTSSASVAQPEFVSPLDHALQIATSDMVEWLAKDYGMEPWAAHLLIGYQGKYDVITVAGSVGLRVPARCCRDGNLRLGRLYLQICVFQFSSPSVATATAFATDWIDYRGPNRDGRSDETNLCQVGRTGSVRLESAVWWRSTPVIHDGRVYVLNPTYKREDTKSRPLLQERVMSLDAATGKVLWEYRYNMYHSDVPPHRIAWSSPSVDPETGNVYVFGVGGTVLAMSRDGKKIWERSLVEGRRGDDARWAHRVPIVEGDKVISGITTGWGEYARAAIASWRSTSGPAR